MQYTKYASALLLSCAILSLQGMNESHNPSRHIVYFREIQQLALEQVGLHIDDFQTLDEANVFYEEELDIFRENNPPIPSLDEKENDKEKKIIDAWFQGEKENHRLLNTALYAKKDKLFSILLEKETDQDVKNNRLRNFIFPFEDNTEVTALFSLLDWDEEITPANLHIMKTILQYHSHPSVLANVQDFEGKTVLFNAVDQRIDASWSPKPCSEEEQEILDHMMDVLVENGANPSLKTGKVHNPSWMSEKSVFDLFEGCKQFYGTDCSALHDHIKKKRDEYVGAKKSKYHTAHACLTALTSSDENNNDAPKSLPTSVNNIIGYMAAGMTAQEVQYLGAMLNNKDELKSDNNSNEN